MKRSELTGHPQILDGEGPLGGPKAVREPLVTGGKSYADVNNDVAIHTEQLPTKLWIFAFIPSILLMLMFFTGLGLEITVGQGLVGINHPVGWGVYIVNFVFWIGIGHAGTLISAILFLFRQNWRTAVNRSAEAMTIFAVMTAGLFPLLHTGRPWFAYWLLPLPNGRGPLWVNFNSPLLWDVFAVGTYFTVSLLFWYVGMIPDLATLRDRATNKVQAIAYGIAAVGWRGSMRHWHRYERAYLLLAALATPLVLSVHSVVSFDFAVSQLPGWHTTIFPPYFVAGAIFSGFAMVMTLAIPAREVWGLKNFITMRHIENMCKVVLLTGSMVGYAYAMEFFMAWYSGEVYESFAFINRAFGQYAWAYWIMVSCNVITPQIFWFKKARSSIFIMFAASLLVNVGMWFERFVIVITSLANDFLPSSWGMYEPTWVDVLTFLGSFGLFMTFFLLFIRFCPVIAIAEIKAVMPQANPHPHGHHDDSHPSEGEEGE